MTLEEQPSKTTDQPEADEGERKELHRRQSDEEPGGEDESERGETW